MVNYTKSNSNNGDIRSSAAVVSAGGGGRPIRFFEI